MRDYLAVQSGTVAVIGRDYRPALQSLRGLAALIVVLHHCSFYYDYDTSIKRVFEFLLNAHGAVVLFFVLSGYVLSASFLKNKLNLITVIEFYARRVFRIYPALWIGVVLALLYVILFHGVILPKSVTAWWWPSEHREFPKDRITYIFTIAGIRTPWPMPLWTLKIELIASVLLPVVAIAMCRMRVVFVIVSFGLAAFVALAPWDVGGTLNYLSVFPLGACIVIVAPRAARYIPSDRWWLVVAVFGTILLLFGRNFFLADYQNHYNAREPIVVEAVGSALLIAACATRQNAFAFLRWPAVVWLGDISYSLYLLHFPIIALVAGVGGEMLGLRIFNGDRIVATGFLTLVVLPIALPAAAVSYRYVELPGIRLGKRLHARVERTNAVVRDAHTRRSLENEGI